MEIPKWLDEPVQVMINCTKVVPVPTHDEFVVQFSARARTLCTWFQPTV